MDIAYKKIKSELKDYLPLLIFLLANLKKSPFILLGVLVP